MLARLESIRPTRFDAAVEQLQAWATASADAAAQAAADASGVVRPVGVGSGAGHAEAARFLLAVMNDESAPLALRIEAAKALHASR